MTSGSDTFLVYQPQVDKWEGNRIELYSAVELKTGKDGAPTYGVVWFNARTEVDKINRLVTLDNVELTKVKFPVAPDKEPVLTALMQQKLPGATKTISLDRLQAALEADGEPVKGVEVKNDPPKIIFSTKDSVLVLIDGPAQLRDVQGTKLQRVINTKAVLLFENDKKTYYLRVTGLVAAGAATGRSVDLREEASRRHEEGGRVHCQPNRGADPANSAAVRDSFANSTRQGSAFAERSRQECADSQCVCCLRSDGID